MTDEQSTDDTPSPQIALVGTTRAGKSVFTAALAKYLEKKRDGVWLSPKGGRPKNTYAQTVEWWNTLQEGTWLQSTPPGTLIELQWDLRIDDKKIPLQMFDYAGENLTDLFSGRKEDATGAAKEFFDKVRMLFENASILLVLINLESFIEIDIASSGERKGTLVMAMSTFLEKLKQEGRSCRVCFVFTAYDQYESVILSKWGSVKNFLEQEIPPLYNEFVDEQSNVGMLPVSAVGETEVRVNSYDGKAVRYPKPGFRSVGFEDLVKWLVEAVGDSKKELDAKAVEAAQNEQNAKFLEGLAEDWSRIAEEWSRIPSFDQLDFIDRFLKRVQQFPYPQQSSAGQLEPQRLEYVNAANDLREKIVRQSAEERRGLVVRGLKVAGKIVAVIMAIIVLKSFVVNYQKSATERLLAEERIAAEQVAAERLKEQLKEPMPTVFPSDGWRWQGTCNTGLFDCWEHRATATVPVKNEGGAGNVTVKFMVGSESATITRYFNRGESAYVYVTIPNMSMHPQGEGRIDVQAAR